MDFNIEDFKDIVKSVYGDIEIETKIEGNVINLVTDEDSKALVIGKGGRNINSLRELVRVYNKLHDSDYQLELVE
jgi:predicted RNA-binding protein YlqC (UPF0109 family)